MMMVRSRGDAPDQRRDPADVLVAHARHRLVEQHGLRIEREGGRDLERALAAVRQLHRAGIREPGEPDRLEQLARAGLELREDAGGPPEVERAAALALQRDPHVLEHGEVGEHRRDLE